MSIKEEMLHILLVEDDDVDAEAVIRAFKKEQLSYPFTVVTNGLDALILLRNESTEALCLRSRPHIILLDLNLPRMNGIEFLQELRADEALKDTIVFVLTTSNRYEDKVAAYNNQVAGYILKTEAGKDFTDMVTLFKCYEAVVEFPPDQGR